MSCYDFFIVPFILDSDSLCRSSFDEVDTFINDICRIRSRDTGDLSVLIVGNKCDAPEEKRQVSREEARKFAAESRCSFVEVSASSGKRIKESLEQLIAELTLTKKQGKHEIEKGAFVYLSLFFFF